MRVQPCEKPRNMKLFSTNNQWLTRAITLVSFECHMAVIESPFYQKGSHVAGIDTDNAVKDASSMESGPEWVELTSDSILNRGGPLP